MDKQSEVFVENLIADILIALEGNIILSLISFFYIFMNNNENNKTKETILYPVLIRGSRLN